jgi:hypothetical protein
LPLTLDNRSEAQRIANYDPLQCYIFDEALNMGAQEAFPYGENIPQDLTINPPFLTISAPLHAASNPVWDYWWHHYRLDSIL